MTYILIITVIVISEYLIKSHIDKKYQKGDTKDILAGRITINKYYNDGAFLNFMEKKKEIVKTVSCVLLGLLLLLFASVLPRKGSRLYKLALSLILGGAISNVSDRVRCGHVIDYFSINCKYKKLKNVVFNLADIAIFLGAFILFLLSVFFAVFQSSANKSAE